MRKVITIILILTLVPLPVLGLKWNDAKPIERPYIDWSFVTKEKVLATREHPEILLGTIVAGCWLLTKTLKGKQFYKQNLKGDFRRLSKYVKQNRPIKIKK